MKFHDAKHEWEVVCGSAEHADGDVALRTMISITPCNENGKPYEPNDAYIIGAVYTDQDGNIMYEMLTNVPATHGVVKAESLMRALRAAIGDSDESKS